jgi:hypothetical protein
MPGGRPVCSRRTKASTKASTPSPGPLRTGGRPPRRPRSQAYQHRMLEGSEMPTDVILLNWTDQGIQRFKDTLGRATAAGALAERNGRDAEGGLLDGRRVRRRGRPRNP